MRTAWLPLSLLLLSCSPPATMNKSPTPSPPAPPAPGAPLVYPESPRGDVEDTYHGVTVADPYRWLEELDSAATAAWVRAQNEVTFRYLEDIPERTAIRERLSRLWNYERYGVPHKRGGRYFYSKNDGLQPQSVLYWAPSLGGEARVLLDPNKLSDDGTVALAGYAISEDGAHIAYGLQEGGSDWSKWRVRDVSTGRDLPDHLRWIKFSGASWTKDGRGFYYSRYPEPPEGADLTAANLHQKLFYHRLGTPQSEDTLVFERPDEPTWGFGANVTEDGRYLVITVWKGTSPKNRVYVQDLRRRRVTAPTPLIDSFDAEYRFLGNRGTTFFFFSDKDAPRGRILSTDVAHRRPTWDEVLPESGDTLQSASLVGGKLIASYLADVKSKVVVHELDGALVRELPLPGLGEAGGFAGTFDDPETFFYFTSFTQPTTIYRYDVASGESELFREPQVDFRGGDYSAHQVFYESADGTRVPMFLVHKKGLKKTGDHPTLLYGYGGFSVSLSPGFSVARAVWLEMGGVLAVANLRGGGEYGEEWHRAGTVLSKQKVFDDFFAAAEWLIAERYTSPAKLAIQGRSNGGLLVGAALAQRPELFAAALPGVGVMDMLRFHTFTIGWAWVDDYGSSDDPEQFKVLSAYSPLHNLKPAAYPATLIVTGDHDDRVVPSHSFKFAAELQAQQRGPAPVLIRIETRAGHGAGKPTQLAIEEYSDEWAFLARALNMSIPWAAPLPER